MIRATIKATVRDEGVGTRSGISKSSGAPYSMKTLQVLDEDVNKVEMTLPDNLAPDQLALLQAGAVVTIVCDISGRGQFESVRVVRVSEGAPKFQAVPAAAKSA